MVYIKKISLGLKVIYQIAVNTDMLQIYRVPFQDFLLYVIDLPKLSQVTDKIMFADDTNLFCKHKNISNLLSNVNETMMNSLK